MKFVSGRFSIESDVINLLEDIQERVKGQFAVYLGGGALRDSYCNKTIKDLDIFFIPLEEGATEVGYIPSKFYVNYNKKTSDFTSTSDMASRGVTQVIGLFNGSMSTKEVQFIVYDKYLTAHQLAEDFDMNICQVVYRVLGKEVTATDEFYKGHEYECIETLHDYCLDRTYDRYCRMEAKFPEYNTYGKPDLCLLSTKKIFELLEDGDCSGEDLGSMV